jgi:NAD+--asparagine ADP-ribosyltransferase
MIAVTEIARAVSQAALANYQQAGVRQIAWLSVAGACSLCAGNEAVGAIRLGDLFPSGADAPPQHPWCRCSVVPGSVGPVVLPSISDLQDILGGFAD